MLTTIMAQPCHVCVQDISGGCGSMFRIKAVAGDFRYVSPAPLHAGQLPVCLPQLPVCPSKRKFAWVSKPLCTPASTGRCSFRQDWLPATFGSGGGTSCRARALCSA